jgi:hypothetical protein
MRIKPSNPLEKEDLGERIKPFNPLERENLAQSIKGALIKQAERPLSVIDDFKGAGIYILYYSGDFLPYGRISAENAKSRVTPVYIGKAIPKGGRMGVSKDTSVDSDALALRLRKHAAKIRGSENLDINHFYFKHLVIEDVFIPLGENILIRDLKPIWNSSITGFGNNAPGSGRGKQKPSFWDVLHPKKGSSKGKDVKTGMSLEDVERRVEEYFAGKGPPAVSDDVESSDSNRD